jgi:hypothetical protein
MEHMWAEVVVIQSIILLLQRQTGVLFNVQYKKLHLLKYEILTYMHVRPSQIKS